MVREILKNICEIGHFLVSLPISSHLGFEYDLFVRAIGSSLSIPPIYSDSPLSSLALPCYSKPAGFLLSTLQMLVLLGIELLAFVSFFYIVLLEPFYC